MKINIRKYFELRGKLSKTETTVIGLVGLFMLLLLWHVTTTQGWIGKHILPSPLSVVKAFPVLHSEKFLIVNTAGSLKLNFLGYFKAILWSIPIGFIIGLFPFFRALLSSYVNAARFLPLSALVGLFIVWFGISTTMKVNFLAFGIMVYLIPVVVHRINEINDTYVDMIYTLGATKWQTIRNVFLPGVMARISDDIKVLVAISWTYIIIAEIVNKEDGIGSLIFTASRKSQTDHVFALLIFIILIGFLQDKLFEFIDRILFPYKHIKK